MPSSAVVVDHEMVELIDTTWDDFGWDTIDAQKKGNFRLDQWFLFYIFRISSFIITNSGNIERIIQNRYKHICPTKNMLRGAALLSCLLTIK